MSRVKIGARLGIGGLMLGALAAQTIAPADAQAPTGEQELIDRIRRIQGELGPGAPPPQDPAARERALIEQIEAIGRDARSEAGAGARPALGEDQVRTLMRDNLGVEVLNVAVVESEGRSAFAVTVMHPPGNDNSAFLVETLLVDGATGGLLGRVPQRPRVASDLAERLGQVDLDGSGLEIRRRSHR